MKGIIFNAKTKEIKQVNDGKPMPKALPDTTDLEMQKAKLKDEILDKMISGEDISLPKQKYVNLKQQIENMKAKKIK